MSAITSSRNTRITSELNLTVNLNVNLTVNLTVNLIMSRIWIGRMTREPQHSRAL